MILKLLLNTKMICNMPTKIFEENNLGKIRKVLIVFDDMITDMISKKRLHLIVTKLFIRVKGRKLNISLASIMQSYFKVPNNARVDSTHYFIMKFPNK